MNIDLHSHSTVSDGLLSPAALVRHARAQGVDVLALTDHDDVSGLEEARAEALSTGLELIFGVEISVTWCGRTIHVVGLKIDPRHPELAAGLARLRASRLERACRIADSLAAAGIPDSLAGAQALASEHILGRSHFARFLVETGRARDMQDAFRKFLTRGRPGYVEHRWAELSEAMHWIRAAGGVVVLAHPGRYDFGPALLYRLLDEFAALGGRGLEVVCGSHSREASQRFAELARRYGLFASRGSDYHGPGQGYSEPGRLPELPPGVVPVWADWPEVEAVAA